MKQANTFKRNIFLDLFRYILIFFVISIHFYGIDFFLPFYRLAVPMFFMISGFFNYSDDKEKQLKKCYGLIKSSLKYMIIGSLIYITYDLIHCIREGGQVLNVISSTFYKNIMEDFIFANLTNNSGYHLWFLIALFVCSLIHYFFVKIDKCKLYYILSPILLIASIFMSGYGHLIFDYSLPLNYTRNAILMGMPIFSIGYLLGKLRNKNYNYKHSLIFISLGVGFLFLSILESKLMVQEFYVCSVLSSIFLLLFFNSLPVVQGKFVNFYYKWIGKNSVFYIYVLHMLVFNVFVRNIATIGFVKRLIVLVISFLIYEIFHLIGMLINKIKLKRTLQKLPYKNQANKIGY